MKIIFLDIDGVLNCASTTECWGDVVGIDSDKVAILNQIIAETGAKIVLSSSWRIDQDWRAALEDAGLPLHHIIGVTGRVASRNRDEEIAQWRSAHGVIDNFVILDDDAEMISDMTHFKTMREEGLTLEIANRVIHYLNSGS